MFLKMGGVLPLRVKFGTENSRLVPIISCKIRDYWGSESQAYLMSCVKLFPAFGFA
jgi:hypothetical protein